MDAVISSQELQNRGHHHRFHKSEATLGSDKQSWMQRHQVARQNQAPTAMDDIASIWNKSPAWCVFVTTRCLSN